MLTVGSGGGGSIPQGGHFRIEPEQLGEAIAAFERIRERLSVRLLDAGDMTVMEPMGRDWVSIESAKAFNEGADQAREVWNQGLGRLDDIIAQLKRSKHAWEEAERANATDLRA